ncbi:hypothetical protein [Aestuariibius sp. HNIBRBA575]|uniref:hypothetical protein n=1 Tax=Aestuariibius sp. HNIBRBA575 TaxID=3233343 RepID=UPI0034A40E17
MIELFLPFVIGTALGAEPEMDAVAAMQDDTAVVLPQIDAGSGDGADRVPEPQVPTGKFTTAVEVKPILGMTKANWVAVRDYEGQDLVYFTHLLSWRCGLWDIRYGVNGAPATEVFPMEPCHEDTASPNAMTDVENFLPYVIMPSGFVNNIYVEITLDDGTVDFARFDRNQVLIP